MAGEGDAERLVVLLEARIRDFEKNMQKASGTAEKSYGRMRKDSRSATRQMEQDMQRSTSRINQMLASTSSKIGAFGKGLVGGLVAGGVAGLVTTVGKIAENMARIGDEAKRAGLSARSFQELAYVARQNRIEVDALTDGMKELALRADEFIVTGKGSAAESFQRLGISADELRDKLKDPSALFTEIIGKLGQLDRAAQIRISDELFGGTAGEKFVQIIGMGEQGIRDMIAEAHRFGAVLSDDVIDSAAELDRKFQIVAQTVGTALKTAIVEASNALVRFIDEFRAFESRSTSSLNTRWSELQTRRGQLTFGEQPGALESGALRLLGKDAETELAAIDAEMSKIAAELKQRALPKLRQELLDGRGAGSGIPPAEDNRAADREANRAAREQEMMNRRLEALQVSLMNEEEAERNSFANRLLAIQEFYDKGMISQQEVNDLTERAQQEHAERMNEISRTQAEQDAYNRQMLMQGVAGTLDALGRIIGSAGDKTLAAQKAVSVGLALINTHLAVTEALKDPTLVGPARFATAAAVYAQGMASVAAIMSTNKGGGGRGGRGGGGSDRGGGRGQPTQAMTINLHGTTQSTESVEGLLAKINEAISDGHKLIVRTV